MERADDTRYMTGGDEEAIAKAFALLKNETRFDILRELWATHQPPEPTPVPYADLLERTGIDDSGNFSYHLGELVGRYVRQVEDGYVLTSAGSRVVRSILSGIAHETPTIEPAEVDVTCPFCGGRVMAAYRGQRLQLRCTACAGAYPGEPVPEGMLGSFSLPPAALAGRDPMELVEAAGTRAALALVSASKGTCPTCAARVDHEVTACRDHGVQDGTCEACGSKVRVQAQHVCGNCRRHLRAPAWMHALWHPAVATFFAEHGAPYDPHSHDLFFAHPVDRFDTELIAEEPTELRVTATCGGETLEIVLDERFEVTDVRR